MSRIAGYQWIVRDRFGVPWRLGATASGGCPGPSDAQRRDAEHSLRDLVACFEDTGVGDALLELHDALYGGELSRRIARSEIGRALLLEVEEQLAFAARVGDVTVERIDEHPKAFFLEDESAPTLRELPVTSEPTTWFSLTVLDDAGRPIDGIEVTFAMGAERRIVKTDGAGVARVEDVESSFATARLSNVAAVREKLQPRWKEARRAADLKGEGVVRAELSAEVAAVSLESETPKTLVLCKPLSRVRLVGMHFDTNKCFLRASAMRGIRRVVEIYRGQPNGKLLIVGHTDATGEEAYNVDLSVERAEAVKAYLKDDVASWEAWFGAAKAPAKRWGNHEVNEMIGALPCEQSVKGFQGWSNRARGTALAVDGDAGPKTRNALIQAYMELDGTTLPESIGAEVHGCGEFFPREEPSEGTEDAELEHRRVEVFCFDAEISPPVPGKKARRGEPEYQQWIDQVTSELDVEHDTSELRIRLHDDDSRPMMNVPYRMLIGTTVKATNISVDGWVHATMPADMCPSMIRLEWGTPDDSGAYPYAREVFVDCQEGAERSQAEAKLHNLGYLVRSDAQYRNAVLAFERDYALPEAGVGPAGELSSVTRDALWSIFETDCDASRPPRKDAPDDDDVQPTYDCDGTGSCFEGPTTPDVPVDEGWVEVALVTEQGEPVAHQAFELLNNGVVFQTGRLDANGRFRQPVLPGVYSVRFPGLDKNDWGPA